ncbi:MAG: DUF3107 family protein [Actinomycetota bacterium]|nr:DUF3107 family protein [Actinomycetota bacterium]
MRVRIGVTDAPKAIEVEVDEPSELIAEVQRAFADDQHLLTFKDLDGRTVVVPLSKLGYLEVEPEKPRWVGFGRADQP